MLTSVSVRNFKTLESVAVPLGQTTVLIGPNNSGKTTALQALALWQTGLQEWLSRRTNGSQAETRTGVTINRRALTHTPVADAKLLWLGKKTTRGGEKVFIDITVEGETHGRPWTCGLEFYHASSEAIYCRPMRIETAADESRMAVPSDAETVRIALLPPMSGLASEEPEVQPGRISVLLGEGQTAQVLRNLCFQVYLKEPAQWHAIVAEIERLYGTRLDAPRRDPARGSIELGYTQGGTALDLPSAGRGLQQTLLLLAHLYANAGSVLLLDEPDAHLEILRQRQIFSLLTETAESTGSQIIAASHSEVVLNEAADKHVVVAFVGAPHRIDDRGSQVLKSLKEIGFEQCYQAELTGFVIYFEGATDLAIMRGLARTLRHPAEAILDRAFVHYVQNQPKLAEHHYYGLREAKPDLVAFALFDNLKQGLPPSMAFPCHHWRRREIENYIASPAILMRYAAGMDPEDLVGLAERIPREEAMQSAIDDVVAALKVLDKDAWALDVKVSEEFLPAVFSRYFARLGTEDRLNKSDFHILTRYLKADEIDAEVVHVLDQIVKVQATAQPRTK